MNLFRENKKLVVITSIIILLPVLAGLLLWDQLPDRIPVHFGIDDQPDGFSSKAFAVFGIPCFMLIIQYLCIFVSQADPKKQNVSGKAFSLVLWIIPVVSILCLSLIYMYALGAKVEVGFVIMMFMGFMLTVIGNYMPKFKQSYTLGIKTPWTLANEETWRATHRLGGILWTVCGILIMVAALLRQYLPAIIILAVMVIVPLAYSYFHYRNTHKQIG